MPEHYHCYITVGEDEYALEFFDEQLVSVTCTCLNSPAHVTTLNAEWLPLIQSMLRQEKSHD